MPREGPTAAEVRAESLRAEAVEEQRERERLMSLSIPGLVRELSPELRWNLDHLAPWIELFVRVDQGESVLGLCAVPIQSGKTETTLHAIVWLLLRHPKWRFVVFTYSFDRAKKLAKRLRELARLAKVGPTKGWDTIEQWANVWGGGVTCMSAEQSSLGEPCECLIFDDPLDEFGARDPKVRDEVDSAIIRYTSRAKVQRADGVKQGPVLGVASRWDTDDPIGRRLDRKAETWESVHSGAIVANDAGELASFAPEVWPLPLLQAKRAAMAEVDPSEREWFAQFQNDPRAAVESKFHEPTYFDAVPEWPGYRWGMGIDLAYTVGGGDWFAVVVAKFYGSAMYVVDVARERADFGTLENMIRARWLKNGQCPIFSYISGPEKGAINYFASRGIPIQGLVARYSKATRAQKTIDRWNAGKIPVQRQMPWTRHFVARTLGFTGHEKARDDDEQDALVSLNDGMGGGVAMEAPKFLGHRRVS